MTHSLLFRDDGAIPGDLDRVDPVEVRGGSRPGGPSFVRVPTSTEVPEWALATQSGAELAWRSKAGGWSIRVGRGEVFDLVSVRFRTAAALPVADFEQMTTEAYARIAQQVRTTSRHPVRLWNFIPGILDPLGDLPHRYMVFNAGRLEGFRRWLQCTDEGLWRALATATGVGTTTGDLVVHCLTADHPGQPVENPRQCPAYRYSERYGPRPPCFARATRIENTPSGRSWVLVGGTASVLGEHTVHPDDLPRQIDETFANLEALVGEALGADADRLPGGRLARFRQLRVYHPRDQDTDLITRRIRARFPNLDTCELQQATLCRPDLLVEIEGLVD